MSKKPILPTTVNSNIEADDIDQLVRDLSSLGNTSEEVRQKIIDVLSRPDEQESDIEDVSLALYNDIKEAGKRLRRMLKQPPQERDELITDEVLIRLIRSNDKMEKEALKYI